MTLKYLSAISYDKSSLWNNKLDEESGEVKLKKVGEDSVPFMAALEEKSTAMLARLAFFAAICFTLRAGFHSRSTSDSLSVSV